MGKVTAHALPFLERLLGRFTGAGVLIAEGDMTMDEVADRLNPLPSGRRSLEQVPSDLGQTIRLAITAAQKKNQGFLGQVLDGVLASRRGDFVRLAGVSDDAGAGDS